MVGVALAGGRLGAVDHHQRRRLRPAPRPARAARGRAPIPASTSHRRLPSPRLTPAASPRCRRSPRPRPRRAPARPAPAAASRGRAPAALSQRRKPRRSTPPTRQDVRAPPGAAPSRRAPRPRSRSARPRPAAGRRRRREDLRRVDVVDGLDPLDRDVARPRPSRRSRSPFAPGASVADRVEAAAGKPRRRAVDGDRDRVLGARRRSPARRSRWRPAAAASSTISGGARVLARGEARRSPRPARPGADDLQRASRRRPRSPAR